MAFVGSGIGSFRRVFPTRARHFHSTCPTMVAKGDKMPMDMEFMQLKGGAPTPVKVSSIFGSKKVAMVTIPGAMTSTCQKSHVPQWIAAVDDMKAKGVDEVVCMAVNDPFVMDAFEKAVSATGKITFVADGGALVTKAIGLDVDTGGFGGVRSKRGGFLIEDGVFTQVNIEADGTGYEGPSKPETLLGQL